MQHHSFIPSIKVEVWCLLWLLSRDRGYAFLDILLESISVWTEFNLHLSISRCVDTRRGHEKQKGLFKWRGNSPGNENIGAGAAFQPCSSTSGCSPLRGKRTQSCRYRTVFCAQAGRINKNQVTSILFVSRSYLQQISATLKAVLTQSLSERLHAISRFLIRASSTVIKDN